MDFSKFKTSDWLKVGGALGFLVFGIFFHWAKVEFMGVSETGNNVFSYPFRGIISLILVVMVGAVTFLKTRGTTVGKVQWPLVSVLATGIATVLMLLLIIMGPDESGFDLKPAIGLYLSFIATVVTLAGSFMAFKESGGNINDLKDINKLKGGFGGN